MIENSQQWLLNTGVLIYYASVCVTLEICGVGFCDRFKMSCAKQLGGKKNVSIFLVPFPPLIIIPIDHWLWTGADNKEFASVNNVHVTAACRRPSLNGHPPEIGRRVLAPCCLAPALTTSDNRSATPIFDVLENTVAPCCSTSRYPVVIYSSWPIQDGDFL